MPLLPVIISSLSTDYTWRWKWWCSTGHSFQKNLGMHALLPQSTKCLQWQINWHCLTRVWPPDSGLNLNLEMLVFGKRENHITQEISLGTRQEPTTNSTQDTLVRSCKGLLLHSEAKMNEQFICEIVMIICFIPQMVTILASLNLTIPCFTLWLLSPQVI